MEIALYRVVRRKGDSYSRQPLTLSLCHQPLFLKPRASPNGVGTNDYKCHQDLAPTPERVPIPAPVALAIQTLAEKLLVTVQWDHSDQRLPLLRACIAPNATYMFFNRV